MTWPVPWADPGGRSRRWNPSRPAASGQARGYRDDVAKFIAIAVTIGAVAGLEATGMNRIAAVLIGVAAGVVVLALLRLSNLGHRQHGPAGDGATAGKRAAANRPQGH